MEENDEKNDDSFKEKKDFVVFQLRNKEITVLNNKINK